MSLKFYTKSINIDEEKLYGSIVELENAVIALFWVGEKPRLGSLCATLPDRTSSELLGRRDEFISKMIGARIASKKGKLALVSTNLPIGFDGKLVLRLLKELLGETIE